MVRTLFAVACYHQARSFFPRFGRFLRRFTKRLVVGQSTEGTARCRSQPDYAVAEDNDDDNGDRNNNVTDP